MVHAGMAKMVPHHTKKREKSQFGHQSPQRCIPAGAVGSIREMAIGSSEQFVFGDQWTGHKSGVCPEMIFSEASEC
jgi:hypothetical protein